MTIQKSLISAVKKLRTKNIPSAHLDAEVLLSFVLKKPKGYLLANQEKKLTLPQSKKFNQLISKRLKKIPIAYLIHQKEFYGLDFFIDKNVMIPRPETELLVEEVIKYSRHQSRPAVERKFIRSVPRLTIADIGTGSGCIAVTLARYLPDTKIYATDISKKALIVAKKNAKKYKVLKRIKFLKGDLLKPLSRLRSLNHHKVDIIVANLPYLTQDELRKVYHEPQKALDGGKLGIEYIDKLLTQAPKILNSEGKIFLEISPTQAKTVDYIVEQQMPEKKVEFKKDLAGRLRVAII